jgi:hypothetical protein
MRVLARPRSLRLLTIFVTTALTFSVFAVVPAAAQPPEGNGKPERITTASDNAKNKLHPRLRDIAEAAAPETISVYLTTTGDPAAALAVMENGFVADGGDVAIIVGKVRALQLVKLAGVAGVVSVGPIDLNQSGQPLGIPDPEVAARPSLSSLQSFLNTLRLQEVPYGDAPDPLGSNFDDLQELAALDARTHDFAEAWAAGVTGTGVTVGVLDGGTDWGHPDLLGTWQTWPAGTTETATRDAGWAGWPMAFDPYGTLLWLVAPNFIDQGLSWYTWTEAKDSFTQNAQDKKNNLWRVSFATRIGPARNFGAPDAFRTHQYTFPQGLTTSGVVKMGSHPDDHLLQLFTERPAFIVVDSTTPGVYDTVYVDLDNDYQFADEKPITKASPAAYRDMNGDGYTDISGGLLYYISDPTTRIPGGLTSFLEDPSTPAQDTPAPPSGDLLAWTGDYDPAIGGHGTLTASNVVGQGVINGKAPCFADLAGVAGAEACPGGGRYPGAVIGGAPDARLAPFGDIYFSFDFSTQLGYFLSNLRGVNITSNSYGASNVDNDGYDAASQEADVIHWGISGGRTTPLFSTGNGAPGFGTTAPPSPSIAISVGASTQFGGTGWDSIANISQVTDDDVMVWSNRGPGATGSTGVDVVADGAFSAGDLTLNSVLSGNFAWETWGGTSRSSPVAAGATALIYDAWSDANPGAPIPAGFALTAKEILKSSAEDLGYDSWIQGAGSVDAGMAVDVAMGNGASVSPDQWRLGDYRGDDWALPGCPDAGQFGSPINPSCGVFAHIIAPGGSDSQEFTIDGAGEYTISDRYMTRTGTESFSFTTSKVNQESPYNFNAPDYLIDISDRVADHPDADLMVVRMNFPLSQYDLGLNYTANNEFRMLTYSWTDVNGDGNLWTDKDHDGAVDHKTIGTSSNIDAFLDINFAASEIDKGEYVRYMYHRAGANTLQSFVRDPNDRMADGTFIGLQHFLRTPAMQTTTLNFQIDFYENSNWTWVTTPPSASGSFTADVTVPDDTPYGMYDGAIVLHDADEEIVVPVLITVAPTLEADVDGNLPPVTFGGADVAAAQADLLYNNGAVFGATDWTWRAESGDWRFFYFDVDADVPDGTLFLVNTEWTDLAPPTDLDTLIFGRVADPGGQVFCGNCLFGAPYVLDTVGASPNTNVGAGIWTFDTATGGAQDLVAAPAQAGLHAVVLHQVLFEGGQFWAPFESSIGTATLDPASIDMDSDADTGSFDITFKATMDLDGLAADAFGLSQPQEFVEATEQDDPTDPSSASIKKDLTIAHASTATFTLDVGNEDVDLFVVFDENSDGNFTNGEIIASSTGPAGSDEFIEIVRPPDGDYQVWAQGWQVSGTPNVTLGIDVIQGTDMTVTGIPAGAIPAGMEVTLTVNFSKAMVLDETYFGEILMGPSAAPSALRVPVSITRVAAP